VPLALHRVIPAMHDGILAAADGDSKPPQTTGWWSYSQWVALLRLSKQGLPSLWLIRRTMDKGTYYRLLTC
jgi:hypothetical protein